MYRTIDTSIWNDPRIRKLDCTSKLLSVYLFTNNSTHITGLYFLSLAAAADDLDIDITKIRKAFKKLCDVGFCRWDEERRVVWVVNMWKRQWHGGAHLDRIQNHFLTLNDCPFIGQFLSKYSSYNIPVTKLSLSCHTPGTDVSDKAVTEQCENSAEKEKEKEKEKYSCTPPATPKKDQVVELKSQLLDYQAKYPNLDITREYEKWQDWMAAKGKTFKNYQAAFRNWLRNAEEFRKERVTEEAPTQIPEPTHPLWPEIVGLRSYDFQVLRQEAMPYARKKSNCGDKRDPPETLTREYMIKLYEAEKPREP